MEERQTRDEFGLHNRMVHRPPSDDEVDGNEENEEDEEYRVRNRGFGDHEARFGWNGHAFPRGRGGRGFNRHPLDETSQGNEGKCPRFFWKAGPQCF